MQLLYDNAPFCDRCPLERMCSTWLSVPPAEEELEACQETHNRVFKQIFRLVTNTTPPEPESGRRHLQRVMADLALVAPVDTVTDQRFAETLENLREMKMQATAG